MLAGPQGTLRVVAATTERMRLVDLFELQSNEGPCLDTYKSGVAILNVSLESPAAAERWPVFTAMARDLGFDTVHALPMGLRDQVIGAANIFHSTPTTISEHDSHLAQALVDAATIGVLQERAVQHGAVVAEQLQHALNSRVVIEQAKGVVAERADVDMDTAFNWLRSYARILATEVGARRGAGHRTLAVRRDDATAVTGAKSATSEAGQHRLDS